MRAVVLMFDSLNRHFLSAYGNGSTHTPNFRRLAERTATFDTSYVASMPCMPARRDFQTGRPNFLHRAWGPLEPFDDSVPQMLKEAGIHCHLATDHYHYFEDGGATYHHRYSTWESFRGQEGDAWRPVRGEDPARRYGGRNARDGQLEKQDRANRRFVRSTADYPQVRTFDAGIDFLRRFKDEDRWMLHLETFDPHEPFDAPEEFQALYREHVERWAREDGRILDWPPYDPVRESPAEVEHLRTMYAALVALCDAQLGRVLDTFDELDLWKDTMLIVWTDHGFLLGEHDLWSKCWMPFYEEVARTPFFVWDPRSGVRGERRKALVQPSIDLGPTLLRFFGLEPTPRMTGRDLAATVATDTPVREAGIFGIFGGQVNVTDGETVYMRAPPGDNEPLHEHTLMPTRMRGFFGIDELDGRTGLTGPLPWARGLRVLKIRVDGAKQWSRRHEDSRRTLLWDLKADPQQKRPIQDRPREARMTRLLKAAMEEADAPKEQYERLGL